jgi:hypothetical protein
MSGLFSDLFPLGGVEFGGTRLSALESTQPPQRDRCGILTRIWRFFLRLLPGGPLNDIEGDLIQVPWTLPAFA